MIQASIDQGSGSRLAAFFMQSGYVRLPEVLPEEIVRRLEETVDGLFAQPSEPYRVNDRGEVCRIEGLLDRSPVFREALQSSPVLPALHAVLGPNIEIALHRHNHVTLNRSGDVPFRLHRDVQQWSRPILDVFIYLEDADVSNGCTHVVPASHLLPYQGPQSHDGAGTWADEYAEFSHLIGQELPVPMPRGGVLLVNALTFHSVGHNYGSRSRRSLVFACHSCDDLISRDLTNHTLLAGTRVFRGNPALRVSGSLSSVSALRESR